METTQTNAVPSNEIVDDSSDYTLAKIATAIETMARTQLNMSKAVAKVIVMAVWASNVNRDAGVANALMANLRTGIKQMNIVNMLQSHGNLAYIANKFVFFDAKKDWSPESVKAIKIAAVGWEKAPKKVAVETRVDLIDELSTLVDRFISKHAKLQLDHADQLDNVRALLGSMQAAALFEGE